MSNTSTLKIPDFGLINVQQLTKRVNSIAKKRRRKHTNLYARLNSLLRGGVRSVDIPLLEDVRTAIVDEHVSVLNYLEAAERQLKADESK